MARTIPVSREASSVARQLCVRRSPANLHRTCIRASQELSIMRWEECCVMILAVVFVDGGSLESGTRGDVIMLCYFGTSIVFRRPTSHRSASCYHHSAFITPITQCSPYVEFKWLMTRRASYVSFRTERTMLITLSPMWTLAAGVPMPLC